MAGMKKEIESMDELEAAIGPRRPQLTKKAGPL